MASNGSSTATAVGDNVVVRVVAYYVVLLAAFAVLLRYWPGVVPGLGVAPVAAQGLEVLAPGAAAPLIDASAATAAVAMLGAVLLALPVAWVYILTRAKRGYQQSVVQTLLILPMVVAGVVALVKHSLPLAFGLAGIVAAVRFRTTLDDSKDAVYVFLATGLGLAAAVDLPIAVVVSMLFNTLVLVLWWTDFGRTPAALDGQRAERRLRRAMEQLSRTGTFVARMDDEVFQDMSAEQLRAVADRAWRRARRNSPEAPDPEGRRESLLRIRTADAHATRERVEPVIGEQFKKWRFGGTTHDPDGMDTLEYIVTLRRDAAPDAVLAALRASGDGAMAGATLE